MPPETENLQYSFERSEIKNARNVRVHQERMRMSISMAYLPMFNCAYKLIVDHGRNVKPSMLTTETNGLGKQGISRGELGQKKKKSKIS